jgi:hypothetical protein
MPGTIDVWEAAKSPTLSVVGGNDKQGSTAEFTYHVQGTDSQVAALTAVANYDPGIISVEGETLIRKDVKPKRIGPSLWEVTCSYARDDQDENQQAPEANTYKLNFKTTGGTAKVTRSIRTIARGERSESPATGGKAPDLHGVIGWDGKKAEGTEIIVPKLELVFTVYYAPGLVTQAWIADLARHTAKTNDKPWLGFQQGELLFYGGEGEKERPTVRGQRTKPVQVQLTFHASENRTDIKIGETPEGSVMTVPSKRGWEYLWCRYMNLEQGSPPITVPTPVHWYVEQMYYDLDYAAAFLFGG